MSFMCEIRQHRPCTILFGKVCLMQAALHITRMPGKDCSLTKQANCEERFPWTDNLQVEGLGERMYGLTCIPSETSGQGHAQRPQHTLEQTA